MITSIGCSNFKCFGETITCKLAPITLLVGENNSGKSSIIQALHLSASTIQEADPDTCLRLQGEDYDYGSFEDIVFQHDKKKHVTLSFGNTVQSESDRQKSSKEEVTMESTFGYYPKRQEVYLHNFVIKKPKGELLNAIARPYKDSMRVSMVGYEDEQRYISRFFHRRSFLVQTSYGPLDKIIRLQRRYGERSEKGLELWGDMSKIETIVNNFTRTLSRVHLLGPLRLPPGRFYARSGSGSQRIGPKGEYAFQNYANLLKRGRKVDRERIKEIKQALCGLGFIKDIKVVEVKGKFSEFWTKHSGSSLTANIADAGFGISQVFPIIVMLYTSSADSTLLLEQPEIHLHPAAQAELGSVLAKVQSQDKRIVVETHSENLILRLQTEVAEGNLEAKDVAIYYVQPNSSGHQVRPIPLNEKGEFQAEWPKGFFEENYLESLKLMKARSGG